MNNSECSYSFEHLQVIDSSTGTVVCGNCGLVLEEGLSYEETRYRYHKEYVSDSDEKIDGEPVKVLLEKIGDTGTLLEWVPWVPRNPQHFELYYCGTPFKPFLEDPL